MFEKMDTFSIFQFIENQVICAEIQDFHFHLYNYNIYVCSSLAEREEKTDTQYLASDRDKFYNFIYN